MKRLTEIFIMSFIVALMLPALSVAQDDVSIAPAGIAVTSGDPVADAEKIIDDGIKEIDEDPGAVIKELIQLAKAGSWGPFVGLLLMFLIWAFRKFIWKLISKKALPWVTLGIGMLTVFATDLGLGVVWWRALINACVTCGLAAIPLLYKRFLAPTEEEKSA